MRLTDKNGKDSTVNMRLRYSIANLIHIFTSLYVLPKRVDQGEALPCEVGQVELIFKFRRIIENLTIRHGPFDTVGDRGMLEEWGAPGPIKGGVLMGFYSITKISFVFFITSVISINRNIYRTYPIFM